jgi:hypothetical protein
MSGYWFKPRRHGYGATPVTWQGWVVALAAVAVMALASLLILIDPENVSPARWIAYAATIGITVAAVWVIAERKTDGVWRWRWGRDD